jgi:hypothetical protein
MTIPFHKFRKSLDSRRYWKVELRCGIYNDECQSGKDMRDGRWYLNGKGKLRKGSSFLFHMQNICKTPAGKPPGSCSRKFKDVFYGSLHIQA